VYKAVLRVLAGQFQAYNLVAHSITREVSIADEEGTLFRSNSAAAKLFTLYMRMIALKYTWHVLVLSLHSLNDNARDADAGRSRDAGSSHGASSRSKVFGNKYRVERDDSDSDEGSVSLDILGASSMELDPQVHLRRDHLPRLPPILVCA
jgi:hypothetical protein